MIEVRSLSKHYPLPGWRARGQARAVVKAVDDVSLRVESGESLGLVGESGSGKSTLGQMLLMQVRPTSGRILFDGKEIASGDGRAVASLSGRIQVVFQDPYDSLSPRMRVRDIVAEPLRNVRRHSEAEIAKRVAEVITQVGLSVVDLAKFPHQFSGGQRQRIGIARAISVEPEFVVLDEAVSALDVSVQAQVVNLLMDLRSQHRMAYLFISHNLAIVEHVCERVAVMYLGRIVEVLPTARLHDAPLHPYTRALLDAVAVPDPSRISTTAPLPGEVPDPANLPAGCRFSTRCPLATDRCRTEMPTLEPVGDGHVMACHRRSELVAALARGHVSELSTS
jgi:peptide/nickel transport system ATP-binding protein